MATWWCPRYPEHRHFWRLAAWICRRLHPEEDFASWRKGGGLW